MGNLHLVTGYAGANHITSADHGALHEHLLRRGDFVMATAGNKLAATIMSNNQVRISDGELMMRGRHVRMTPGTYVDLAIENGAQSMHRIDLVVARYTRDPGSGVEDCNLVVIKGNAVPSDPVAPAFVTGDLNANKDLQHDFPLYHVIIEGLNLVRVDSLFVPQLPLYELMMNAVLAFGPGNSSAQTFPVKVDQSGWRTISEAVAQWGTPPASSEYGLVSFDYQGDDSVYAMAISNPAFKATDMPLVDVNLSAASNASEAIAYRDAWACIDRCVIQDNWLVLYALEKKPTSDTWLWVKVVE